MTGHGRAKTRATFCRWKPSPRALPGGARLIGIDVGTKTLGLALSDVTRTIASGLVTLRRSRFAADADRLLELAAEHGVGGFVIGLPLNLDGSEGPRVQATRAFARNLAQLTPLAILLWDERLSTVAAERIPAGGRCLAPPARRRSSTRSPPR